MNQASAVAEAIRAQAGPDLAASGVEIDEVTVQPAGKRRVVRVTVARAVEIADTDEETPLSPLSLDEVAEASRIVSTSLDDSDVMGPSAYTLEVSSAGVGQPLTTPAHFRRNVGRLLSLTWADGTAPTQERLLAAGADGIRTDADPQRRVGYAEITKAKVEVEFSRPTETGKDR